LRGPKFALENTSLLLWLRSLYLCIILLLLGSSSLRLLEIDLRHALIVAEASNWKELFSFLIIPYCLL